MNLTYVVAVWAVLGMVTLGLAVYRFFFANQAEDDYLKLALGQEGAGRVQASLAKKIDRMDVWGQSMTILIAVVGLGLASAYLYQAWISPNPGPNNFYRMNSLPR